MFPYLNKYDFATVTIKQNSTVFFSKSLSGADDLPPMCFPRGTVEYSVNCTYARYDNLHRCHFELIDESNIHYLGIHIQQGQVAVGEIHTNTQDSPQFLFDSVIPLFTNQKMNVWLPIQGIYSNLTISPSLPINFTLTEPFHMITGVFNTSGLFSYTLSIFTLSYQSLHYPLIFAVDMCPEGREFFTLHHPSIGSYYKTRFLTLSHSTLFNSDFSLNPQQTNLCLEEGNYLIELEYTLQDGLGWNRLTPFTLDYQQSIISSFSLPTEISSTSIPFSFLHPIKLSSTYKYSFEYHDEWTSPFFDDSLWSIGQSGWWGSWEPGQPVLFLRKVFSLKSLESYSLMYLDIRSSDPFILYLNNQQLTQSLSLPSFTRFSFTLSYLHEGVNILAIQITSSLPCSSAAIDFDAQLMLITSGCTLQSNNVTATDYQQSPSIDFPISHAFDLNTTTYWKINSFPATGLITFPYHSSHIVNSLWIKFGTSNKPLSLTLEGLTGNTTTSLFSYSPSTAILSGEYWYFTFMNIHSYSSYQITFTSPVSPSSLKVHEIRLNACEPSSCPTITGAPTSVLDTVIYQACPLQSIGLVKTKCILKSNKPEWFTTEEGCIAKTPTIGKVFIDWKVQFFNTTQEDTTHIFPVLKEIIIKNLAIKEDMILYPLVLDKSTIQMNSIQISIRFIVDQENGEHVFIGLKNWLPQFENVVHSILSKYIRNISGSVIEQPEMRIHSESHWIIFTVLICFIIVVLLCVLLAQVNLKRKRFLQTKSRSSVEIVSLLK